MTPKTRIPGRRSSVAVVVLAISVIVSRIPARAHEPAVPLTFWADNFQSAEARCQLEVAAAAATCGLRTWDIRRTCLLSRLDRQTCDDDADDAAIEDLRIAVFQGDISSACRDADLSKLLFSNIQDVQFGAISFCRELEASAVSVVFNPLFAVGDADSLTDNQKSCVRAFASTTTKAFDFAFRSRTATLNDIAKRRRSSRAKNLDVGRSDRRVAQADESLRKTLAGRCDSATFESLYGFPQSEAVGLVSSRSACLAVRTYPVLAYDCPTPVCGNGMREIDERCDDGNTDSGDGCGTTCQIEL